VRAAWAIARKEFRAAFASPVAYAWLVAFLGFTNWFFFRGFFARDVMMRSFVLVPDAGLPDAGADDAPLVGGAQFGTIEVLLTCRCARRRARQVLGALGMLRRPAGLPIVPTSCSAPTAGRWSRYLGLLPSAAGLAVGSTLVHREPDRRLHRRCRDDLRPSSPARTS
jgi:hypothetical protein